MVVSGVPVLAGALVSDFSHPERAIAAKSNDVRQGRNVQHCQRM